MVELFRARGLKVTPQRVSIFDVPWRADSHPSAEAVFAEARVRIPALSLKTVYQTLNDLAQMGELVQLDLGTRSSRFDPNVEVHHHLVCTRCDKVRDVHADYPAIEIPPGEDQGFAVGSAEVVFRGLCEECRDHDGSIRVPTRSPGVPASARSSAAPPPDHTQGDE
jgi:Fe2+ or Zn2+ uptake regulation protein